MNSKERAWSNLLEFDYQRVTGSKEERKAAECLLNKCIEADVEAHLEEFAFNDPKIDSVYLSIDGKEYPSVEVIQTDLEDHIHIEGTLKYVDHATENSLYDCKDKVVLISTIIGSEDIKRLKQHGVLAYIMVSGSIYDDERLYKELRHLKILGEMYQMPGLIIHIRDAEEIVRSKGSQVVIDIQGDHKHISTSQNVVATIPGIIDETVVFTAHYDSVLFSKGPWDNMSGCITILELLYYFNEHKPYHTLKFIWCGGEELGEEGSRAYTKRHQDELDQIIFDMNVDMTGCTIGYEYCCMSASQKVLDDLNNLANQYHYPLEAKIGLYSSDASSFVVYGVPACTFARLASDGGAVYHDYRDSIDRMDPDSFMITLEFLIKYADLIVNSKENRVDHNIDSSLNERIEKRKAWSLK